MLKDLLEIIVSSGPLWFRAFTFLLLLQIVAWFCVFPFIKKNTEKQSRKESSPAFQINGPNVNKGNQFFISGNNNQIILPLSTIPHSARLPLWRTLELSNELIPPIDVCAVKFSFESENGFMDGVVRVQGAENLYHFDTRNQPNVSVPLPADRRVLEYSIEKVSSRDLKYSIKLSGFEFR